MKLCTKCKETKAAEAFPKDPRLKSGLSSQCRACHSIRSRRYYANNRDKVIKRSRQWFAAHPGYGKAAYARDIEARRAAARERYRKSIEDQYGKV